MITKRTLIWLILLLLSWEIPAQAQLDVLIKKAKDKAGKVLEKEVNTGDAKKSGTFSPGDKQRSGNFIAGDSLIFAEDFSGTPAGTSSRSFKSNGVANVETVSGFGGKWLALRDKATYKLSRALIYPRKFTVEFDLLATGDNVKDIAPLTFGFATDNSAREYTSGAGAYTELQYYDGDEVNFSNSSPQNFVNTTFDLAVYLNRKLHIALFVDGQQMAVYLDGQKLYDGTMFNPSAAKNFYITAPWEYKNGARVVVGNFKIYGFR